MLVAVPNATSSALRKSPVQIVTPCPEALLHRWFGLVRDQPDRLSSSRFLVLGPELTETLELPLPSAAHLIDLLRTLRDREPDVFGHAEKLAWCSAAGREALLEIAVDELLRATGDWAHPSQVLEAPRPEYRELVPICERRKRQADDDERGHVEVVTRKVVKAAEISEEARRRRERIQPGQTKRKRKRRPDGG
jgi:hypothetical protein